MSEEVVAAAADLATIARLTAERDAARKALEWYANPKNYAPGIVGDCESEVGYKEPGGIPGQWGLMPGCRCGMCHDYWHADNGDRARKALAPPPPPPDAA